MAAVDKVMADTMSALVDGIASALVDEHYCEDDVEVGTPMEAWEAVLQDTLLEGAIRQTGAHLRGRPRGVVPAGLGDRTRWFAP